jgi:hypothetical protein
LRNQFTEVLNLDREKDVVFPENSLFYVAIGAALTAREQVEREKEERLEKKRLKKEKEKGENAVTVLSVEITNTGDGVVERKLITNEEELMNKTSGNICTKLKNNGSCGCVSTEGKDKCDNNKDECRCGKNTTTDSNNCGSLKSLKSFSSPFLTSDGLTHIHSWSKICNEIFTSFNLISDNVRLPPLFNSWATIQPSMYLFCSCFYFQYFYFLVTTLMSLYLTLLLHQDPPLFL